MTSLTTKQRPTFTQPHFYSFRSAILRFKQRGSGAGFTMVELLVYISMSAIVMVVFSDFAISTSRNATKSKIIQELDQNARLALDRLTQEVHGAQAINASTSYVSPYTLVLTTAAGNHTFALNGSQALTLDTGSGAAAITGSKVQVTSFQVVNTSPSVTITMTLADTLTTPPQTLTVTTSLIPHQILYQ